MKTIYISSTYKDLVQHRSVVHAALRKVRHDVRCMEDYVAKDDRTDQRCKHDAARCHIYIGIFAWRYGYVPSDDNPQQYSITEMEYRAARSSDRTTVLVYLLADDVAWPPQMMDSATGENKGGTRIASLRNELSKHSPGLFRTPDDLATQVLAAVYLDEATKRITKIELFDSNFSTFAGSGMPDIDSMIAEAKEAGLVEINLGRGNSWWTTRLHLTAALATDFTNIQQIVFVDDRSHLIGMYSPGDIRHGLATAFPTVEIAYLQSHQHALAAGDASASAIVRDVGRHLQQLSGDKAEQDIKEWVTENSLARWLAGKRSGDRVALTEQPASLLQHQILSSTSRFVALVRKNVLEQVVDRVAMVTDLAKSVLEEQFREVA